MEDLYSVTADHLSSAPSIQFPVTKLVQLCHSKGVMVVVNGTHAPGQVPLDLTDLDADFYVGKSSSFFSVLSKAITGYRI